VGNTLQVSEMVKHHRPVELRYYLGSAHYRSVMDYSPEAITEAATAYRRIENFVQRGLELVGEPRPADLAAEFVAALDDDLGVPAALAVIHETVRQGNAATESDDVDLYLRQVLDMTSILGINPLDWESAAESDLTSVVDSLVQVALEQRKAARERKDYAAADAVRDQLAAAGVLVEDTATGQRWTLKEN
jgi:cysteinyl-tRNA synthetase